MDDYKKYSLEKLEEWVYDALSTNASPQEIYDTICGVVKENYYSYKKHTSRAYQLLGLLNSIDTSQENKKYFSCDKNDTSSECKGAWNDFWEENYYPEENKKQHLTYDEMIKSGFTMTADGFWMKEGK